MVLFKYIESFLIIIFQACVLGSMLYFLKHVKYSYILYNNSQNHEVSGI